MDAAEHALGGEYYWDSDCNIAGGSAKFPRGSNWALLDAAPQGKLKGLTGGRLNRSMMGLNRPTHQEIPVTSQRIYVEQIPGPDPRAIEIC